MPFARPVAIAGLIGLASLCSLSAVAQQVYRIVGPDGRVTFSDRPPMEAGVKAAPAALGPQAAASAALPFELRNAAARYPVTLYTGLECAPCQSGRNFLTRRGIPFSEKTVTTQQDIEALNRLAGGGGATLPFVTIGAQQLKGYSEAEWTQFLDAAGYPKTSMLPASYRPGPATPLVVVQQVERAQAPAIPSQPQRAEASPVEPSGPNPNNPAGIRF
jgi:glutaredoxin